MEVRSFVVVFGVPSMSPDLAEVLGSVAEAAFNAAEKLVIAAAATTANRDNGGQKRKAAPASLSAG